MFKKTALAVLGLTVNSIAAAGGMGPVCTPGNVSVPCENRGWELGIQALYLQPTLTNELTYYGANIVDTATSDWQAYNHWDWGFKLEGAYHFNKGKDITLNWYHLNSKANYGLINNPTFSDNMTLKWDAVHLELAQLGDFSANQKFRFHGGLAYARISSQAIFEPNRTDSWSSYFSGLGPRAGIDLNYLFGNGLSIYTKTGAALLVGTNGVNAHQPNGDPFSGKSNPVIPELDARLGGMYTYSMQQSTLSLDAGWMWTNYFQSQQSGFDGCDSNFSISGPYVGLNYAGNL